MIFVKENKVSKNVKENKVSNTVFPLIEPPGALFFKGPNPKK